MRGFKDLIRGKSKIKFSTNNIIPEHMISMEIMLRNILKKRNSIKVKT